MARQLGTRAAREELGRECRSGTWLAWREGMPTHAPTHRDDPAQTLDDVGPIDVDSMDVDAMPVTDSAEDLARAIAESKEGDLQGDDDNDNDVPGSEAERPADTRETGKLYGVRTPHAADTELAAGSDHGSFEGAEEGESWMESLSRHAAESGAEPAEDLDVDDENDDHGGAQPTESGDRPVADKGSGGPGGL
jgi:hypothetical protein